MSDGDMVSLEGEVVRETERAWLFCGGDFEEEVWLPKSQVEWDADEGVMLVPHWLAYEKGLI